jgi:hypothetical protein
MSAALSEKDLAIDTQSVHEVDHAAVLDSWDASRERKLYRKIDFHLLPPLIALYLLR